MKSKMEPGRNAARMPSGNAIKTPMIVAASASSNVAGMRCAISLPTG